jgi:hypothetical protein
MRAKNLIFTLILPFILGFNSDKISEPGDDTPVALVKKIVKDVTYKKGGNDWEEAKTGLPLKNGEDVRTGSKSLALILFTDGSGLLRVRENAILNIYGEKNGKKLNKNTVVNKGLIGFDVNKQAEDEEFKFTTPTAVASIRGTAGFLEVDENKNLTFSLESGSSELQSLTGEKLGTVTAGNTAKMDDKGNFSITPTSDADKKKNEQTRTLTTKKITIMTNKGAVVIEYYTSGN